MLSFVDYIGFFAMTNDASAKLPANNGGRKLLIVRDLMVYDTVYFDVILMLIEIFNFSFSIITLPTNNYHSFSVNQEKIVDHCQLPWNPEQNCYKQ